MFFTIAYKRTEKQIYTIGDLTVTEKAFARRPLFPKSLKSVDIDYKGISFDISINRPVILLSDDGIKRKSRLLDLKTNKDSVEVYLENNIKLLFTIDNDGERLTIHSSIPVKNVFPEVREVKIPLLIKESHIMEKTELSYKIFNESEEFHLKFNDNYTLSDSNSYIKLIAENKKISTLTFSHLNTRDLPIAEEWYMKHRVIKDLDLSKTISNYQNDVEDAINRTFNNIRYYPVGATWDKKPTSWENIPKKNDISEDNVIIYLSNSVRSPDYKKSYFKALGLKKQYPDKFSYKSTPFLGDIVKNGYMTKKLFNTELNNIRANINNNSEILFNKRIKDDYFKNNNINIYQLERIINDKSKKDLGLKQLSISLENLLKITEYGTNSNKTSDSIKEITNLIIQKIYWTNSKLYLIDGSVLSDQLLNFETGLLLIKSSQHETSEYAKPIGEALVESFLTNRDFKGDIAKTFNTETGNFSNEVIPGSEIYLKLSKNPNLPHFYQEKDILIYTIAQVYTGATGINNNSSEIRINVEYPFPTKNSNPHTYVISGIKPYKQIYLGGRLWRPDVNFEKWNIGYYYDQNSELLYFMVNNKSKEEIKITF